MICLMLLAMKSSTKSKDMRAKIYLIPNLLSETDTERVIPAHVRQLAVGLSHFVVENEKVSRRYLKKLDRSVDIDRMTFYGMGKHSDSLSLSEAISSAKAGNDIGVISDAGCPGVADPGSEFIAMAHRAGLEIVPLVGPSSILLTLMASGMNGQNFTFHGYVPKEKSDRTRLFKFVAQRIAQDQSTHLFMDTPFRNMSLYEEVIKNCPSDLQLCIARDITGTSELIQTKSIGDWKRSKVELNKIPVLFALGY